MTHWTKALTALLVVAGCAPLDEGPDGTLGTEGRVAFVYQRNCFFGCPIGQPLLSGSQQTVQLSGPGDGQDVAVRSSDLEVADFSLQRQCYCEQGGSDARIEVADDAACRNNETKQCDNTVLVQARAAGDVFLELDDADGQLIDRVQLEIRDADRARFAITLPGSIGAMRTDDFDLRVGDRGQVEAVLYDAEGRELLAPAGVHWSVGDDSIVTVSGFLIGGGAELDDGLGVDLNAVAPGDTELHLSVPGLDDAANVHVDASD